MSETWMKFIISSNNKEVIDYMAKVMKVPDSVIVSQIIDHALNEPFLEFNIPESERYGDDRHLDD